MLVEAYQLLDGWLDDFRCIIPANLRSDNIGSKTRGSMSYIPAVGDPSSVRLFRSMSRTQSMPQRQTEHIREIALAGNIHSNKMERQNEEWRDRTKTMRGFKIDNSPILTGYQVFHNFIRPHTALDGKTPAEACGITMEDFSECQSQSEQEDSVFGEDNNIL